jgi:hypothetical protein
MNIEILKFPRMNTRFFNANPWVPLTKLVKISKIAYDNRNFKE